MPPRYGGCVVNAGQGQAGSFGSLRIAVPSDVWPTSLTIASYALMEYKRMDLDYKRFRSQAPSAASVSPGPLVSPRTKGFDLLHTHYYDTVFRGRGNGNLGDLDMG